MSSSFLQKNKNLADDLESFFWVALYLCTRFLPHTVPLKQSWQYVARAFDCIELSDDDRPGGGDKKYMILMAGRLDYESNYVQNFRLLSKT